MCELLYEVFEAQLAKADVLNQITDFFVEHFQHNVLRLNCVDWIPDFVRNSGIDDRLDHLLGSSILIHYFGRSIKK